MTTRTQELAAGFAGDIVALRRDLHQNPEIGLDLPQTQQRILDALAPLDLEITLGKGLMLRCRLGIQNFPKPSNS